MLRNPGKEQQDGKGLVGAETQMERWKTTSQRGGGAEVTSTRTENKDEALLSNSHENQDGT